jgi:hypothetical protein
MSAPDFAILRLAKLKSLGNAGGSLLHTYRARDTPNADPALTTDNSHSHLSHAEAMASLRARIPAKHRSDAVLAIEYFVGSSPEWFKDKTQAQQDAYFTGALDWLKQQHGSDNLVAWSIHRDESSPHLVAYVVPIDPDTGRLNAKKWTGGKAVLSKMQTDFAQQVGQVHEMQRGIEGSKARHQTIQKFYGQLEQPAKHVTISPETAAPQVVKKGFFSTEYEEPQAVAQRLTKSIQRAYAPAVENAKLAHSEHLRATEMARTALAKDRELKEIKEKFTKLTRTLQPFIELAQLAKSEYVSLFKTVSERISELHKQREIDVERQRRIDKLAKLKKNHAGTAHTLAGYALAALDLAKGDPAKVNWEQVERVSAQEAVQINRQSPQAALQAIVEHSPGMADPARRETASKMILAIPVPHDLAPTRTVSKKRDSPGHSL